VFEILRPAGGETENDIEDSLPGSVLHPQKDFAGYQAVSQEGQQQAIVSCRLAQGILLCSLLLIAGTRAFMENKISILRVFSILKLSRELEHAYYE